MDNIEAYENLAIAIVTQAIIDYKKALKKLEKNPNNINQQRIKNECEIFFKSDYFDVLTNVDVNYLLKNMERMNKNAKKTIQQIYKKRINAND